jgi:hypothetical protein
MLTATCPKCGRVNRVADESAGQKVPCGQCGATVRVPGEATVGAPAAAGEAWPPPPTASVGTAAVASAPPPRPAAAFAAPPRRRLGFRFNRITLGMIIGGGVMGFFGSQELLLASRASATPQDITCEQLGKTGYGRNAHVRVHDFLVMPNYVYKEEEHSTKWQDVWVPLASFESAKAHLKDDGKPDWDAVRASGEVRVLLLSHDVPNEAAIEAVDNADTIDGMVINSIDSLGSEEKAKLAEDYPKMSLDTCVILEHNRHPNHMKGLGLVVGGVALAIGGLVVMLKPR